jgi:hypothetical protein
MQISNAELNLMDIFSGEHEPSLVICQSTAQGSGIGRATKRKTQGFNEGGDISESVATFGLNY